MKGFLIPLLLLICKKSIAGSDLKIVSILDLIKAEEL